MNYKIKINCTIDLIEEWMKDKEWKGSPQLLYDFLQNQLNEQDDLAVANSIQDILEILDFQTGGGVEYLDKWITENLDEAQDLDPIDAMHIMEYKEEWDDPDCIPMWQRA